MIFPSSIQNPSFFEKTPPASVLIVKPSSLGDIVHALPCVAAMRRHWPSTHISWIVHEAFTELLQNNRVVDAVIPFRRNQYRGLLGGVRALPWFYRLSFLRPELALDLQGLFRSALMGRASRPRFFLGLSDAREGARRLFPYTVEVDPGAHAVQRLLQVLPVLGIPFSGQPEFPLPEEKPGSFPLGEEPFLAIHPFARGQGKSLSREVLSQICSGLKGKRVVIVGQGNLSMPVEGCVNLLNRTSLPELVWILRRASCVLSVDSGPAHIAAAVNSRVLSIHTWSHPGRVGPFGAHAFVWKGGELNHVSQLSAHALSQTREVAKEDVPRILDWLDPSRTERHIK